MVRHLYVHIPFCPKVCPYCSFYKEASDRNKTQKFLDAVLKTAQVGANGLRPQTIFFGGGTPTALSTTQLQFLIRGLRERIDFSDLAEFTVEMNPATVSLEKAQALLELGVNRVSMGVQSWDPGLLLTLGRVHSAEQARRSFEILRAAGVKNINLDLIFGIPGQTEVAWRDSLRRTIDLEPDHVSAYCLTYEEDTEFFRRFQRGEMSPDEGRDADFFEIAMMELEAAGFVQYEISNYAQPGRECRHNLAYWLGADYEGLGPSAFSTRGEVRRRAVADTSEFIRRVESGLPWHDFEEPVDRATRESESLAFALRTNRGIPEKLVPAVKAAALLNNALAERSGDRIFLTRQGRMVADEIAAEIL
jgi:oxygen-independent coproporphyrinogen-3 oxidase